MDLVFVRWNKKTWHAFLCTETGLDIAEILNYYSRRWAIECFFRDCKQLLELGKGQSETFDAVVAWTSIVMIRPLPAPRLYSGQTADHRSYRSPVQGTGP